MGKNIASSAEAEIGTETVKKILLTPARYKELLSTLESLQRENEELKRRLFPYADRTDISGMSWDGKYLIGDKASISAFHEMQNRGLQIDVYKRAYDEKEAALKSRAESAEASEKKLREALERFLNYHDADYVPNTLFDLARNALSSTGDTHGN